jgi:hypothetical protein
MKLLAKKEAEKSIKKSNEELLGSNLRLRQLEKNVLSRLNTAKLDYEPEKMKALKDFEEFVADLSQKKSKLLEEMHAYNKLIQERKDIYYGLIEKQDLLEEKIYQMNEENRKLDLRETFIRDLEQRVNQKANGL